MAAFMVTYDLNPSQDVTRISDWSSCRRNNRCGDALVQAYQIRFLTTTYHLAEYSYYRSCSTVYRVVWVWYVPEDYCGCPRLFFSNCCIDDYWSRRNRQRYI